MAAKKFMTQGYKTIIRFFKEIKLYKEFLDYCNDSNKVNANFIPYEEDPLRNFGNTSISHWMEKNKRIKPKDGNFFDYFKAWLFVFYPELYKRNFEPSKAMLERVDKNKRTINIEYVRQ